MSNITLFNSLTRQLLVHLGDDEGTNIIVGALGNKARVKVLRTLAFNDKTSYQIMETTGIPEATFHRAINKLLKLGVIESKGKRRSRPADVGGPDANVWGLV